MDMPRRRPATGPRLIAIVGPYQSGKTTLLEALLFRGGAISRQGKALDKTLSGDASAEARGHSMGIDLNVGAIEYFGDHYTFVDCPGSVEFGAQAQAVLPVCDAAIVVCDADSKKAPALQLILRQLDELNLPRFIFLNKIDRSDTSPRDVLAWMQPTSVKPLLLRQLPLWSNGVVNGFVDLASERAYVYRELAESHIIDLPTDVSNLEKAERFTLLETLAEHDDELMEQLLTDIEPAQSKVFDDLSKDVHDGHITPVLFGSAEHGNGVGRLLKALRHDGQDIAATAARLKMGQSGAGALQVIKTQHSMQGGKLSIARVLQGELTDGATVVGRDGQEARVAGLHGFKGNTAQKIMKASAGETVTVGRLDSIETGETLGVSQKVAKQIMPRQAYSKIYGIALTVADRKDEVKLTSAIAKLIEEDPSLGLQHDHDTSDMVLWGQGEMHLRIAMERLASKFGVQAKSNPRRIAYKETIRGSTEVRGRHRKQSGGHGQFGDVVVTIAPTERGQGFQFSDTITGGVVPKTYIPAVEAGVRDWMQRGTLGFPVVDFAVTLTDGSYHDVDSSELAFKTAARIAMVEGMPKCSPVLLEPILLVEIHCPNDATPRVNQIVSGHRGHLLGFDGREGWMSWDTVKAHMPEAEMASLIIELRSATAGVGTFTYEFDHLAELTGKMAERVVQMAQAA